MILRVPNNPLSLVGGCGLVAGKRLARLYGSMYSMQSMVRTKELHTHNTQVGFYASMEKKITLVHSAQVYVLTLRIFFLA